MAELPSLQRSHSIEMPSLLADLPIDNSSVFSKCALDAPHKAHKVQAHWALFAQPKDCPIMNITSTPTIAPLEALIKAKNDENRKENGDGNDDQPPALLDDDDDDDENEESMDEIVPDEDEEIDDDEDSDDSSTSHLDDGDDGPPPLEENNDDSPQHVRHCQCRH